MTDARTLVDELGRRLQPLERAANEGWWVASTRVSDEHDRQRVAAELALTDALADAGSFAELRAALADDDPGAGDPLVARQLRLLHDGHAPHQVGAELRKRIVELGAEVDSEFSSFRGDLAGRRVDDNEIARILRTSDDEDERRNAWEASKQVGAVVAQRVRELARLRNRAAHDLGYRDYFAMVLATSELEESRLFATLDEVDDATAEPFARWKAALDAHLADRFARTVETLRPWHYDNPFFQHAPVSAGVDLDPYFVDRDVDALIARTYRGIGIDVTGVLARSDLLPREGKNQHAFCIHVDRGGDVRVLCNNVPSHYWAETMLHELGHGVYDIGLDPALPWTLRTTHPLATEGVAILFGHLSEDPAWLERVVGLPSEEVDALRPRLGAAFTAGLLTFARWVLVMTNFERGLYADPDADHNSRWWELVERFQLLHRPEGRDAPDWAAKIHVASAPVYYQNYLLGELVALQLRATIAERFGGLVDREDAGRFLAGEFFRPGASLRWDDLVERATGHPLTARHLSDALAG
ncbi:MAG: M2 family metallopeptidase [Acidimicrobiia bacterium]